MEEMPLSFGFWKLAEAVVECEGPNCELNFFCVNITSTSPSKTQL